MAFLNYTTEIGADKSVAACPSADAVRCVEIRYPRYMSDDDDLTSLDDEKCGCMCHDAEDDDDEPFWER